MSEFEDKLNSILSSPDQMQKIMDMAKQLSSSAPHGETKTPSPAPNADGAGFPAGLDPKMLKLFTKVMQEYGASGDEKAELVHALRPYLRAERQQAMDRAVELTKLAKLARLALHEFSGGDGHV